MACNKIKVLLGYDDEEIDDKYKGLVDYSTNKIGGKPDYPPGVNAESLPCPLCQLPRLLVVQIYAPLDTLSDHRVLYVFACINPNCWNQNESWCCVRSQYENRSSSGQDTRVVNNAMCWAQDADDWGDDDDNANSIEKNGNMQEDDDETIEEKMECLYVDDRNANSGSLAEAQGGAVGSQQSPLPTAEIEGDEGEIISIDTPTYPQNDIMAILQEVASLPQEICQIGKQADLQFIPYFINVSEKSRCTAESLISYSHVNELLSKHKMNDDYSGDLSPNNPVVDKMCGGEETLEKYEEALPAHGDGMFHDYLLHVQGDPGHILRYGRGSKPLLLRPLQDKANKCQYCQGDMVFEFQILPTMIPILQLTTDRKEQKKGTRLEYGNVLIFTCDKSCWSTDVSIKFENVFVQAESF